MTLKQARKLVSLVRSLQHPDRWQVWESSGERPTLRGEGDYRTMRSRAAQVAFDITQAL